MWGYVSGTKTKPVDGDGDNYAVLLDTWEVDNSKKSTVIESMPHSKVSIDECSYCKQKGHWKSQCPNILKRKPQTPQNWPPQQQRPSQPNNGVTAPFFGINID
ncbi:gag-pol polyprotein [Tanacetum coccineum]